MSNLKLDFISIGGNRHPSAADWDSGGSGLLAFGAANNIALWNPSDGDYQGIKALLSGHTKAVNAVKFFSSGNPNSTVILSGSGDKTLRIWRSDLNSSTSFELVKTITDHQSSITCISTFHGSTLFASGAADGEIKVWKVTEDASPTEINVELLQSIALSPRYFPLSLALAKLDESSLVLAAAGTRSTIQIYVSQNARFNLAATLTGHKGWIRSLDFVRESATNDSDLLLASASQDKYIRLWRVHPGEELPAVSSAINDPALGVLGKGLSNKAHRIESAASKYSITYEALLLGHEDWIYTVSWRHKKGKLQLLSTSEDNSLAIWERDTISGVWVCITRLGEISAQKGSTTATGSAGGFWIGLWALDGQSVVSLGRTGSWRLWTYQPSEDVWVQQVAITGHVDGVKGICWAKDGSYLLSTSSDQTTRLFAQWRRGSKRSWHEFSRPQIHGYDLNCIDSVSPFRFISGADEKLLRVFDEPRGVAGLLNRLCGIRTSSTQSLPDAANIPVLGLSNKAIQAVDDDEPVVNDEEGERDAVDPASVMRKSTLDFNHPPFEDHLARHLLWPETEKLYGHGYEISAVATSKGGDLVATACRASSLDHAVIRLYETKEWREIGPPLRAHSLTVTSLEFSEDDHYLLSVGRDRQWAVFQRKTGSVTEYKLAASNPKGHSRMILDGSWAPTEPGRIFATAGRDKAVRIWQLSGSAAISKTSISANAAATAVSFLKRVIQNNLILAYGTEEGRIVICGLSSSDIEKSELCIIEQKLSPMKAINQLAWRPSYKETISQDTDASHESGIQQLAVASDDSSVRIFRLHDLPTPQ
ncbi:RNA polymeras-like protein II Elongator subunit [Lepidopterella palustris CBS 459.81]|uniref:Elongator complex protein 2 n=1 Tax=Lepidopterella palustris CBS 459.81 TaxID=1314670 RepID=A0A8E2JK66_9PEZI|nr:RNA polymeras-like protein II Elongator subunit [Lepidopterella palustris CBS 459.81]